VEERLDIQSRMRLWAVSQCRHAHKMLDKAEELTCDDCLIQIVDEIVKQLLQQKPRGKHIESTCQRCGGRNLLAWYADNDTWNEVTDDMASIICPICFGEIAKERGLAPTAWRLSREGDEPEINKLRVELANLKEQKPQVDEERIEDICDLIEEHEFTTMSHEWANFREDLRKLLTRQPQKVSREWVDMVSRIDAYGLSIIWSADEIEKANRVLKTIIPRILKELGIEVIEK